MRLVPLLLPVSVVRPVLLASTPSVEAAATVPVTGQGALVRSSEYPALSVNDIFTLTFLP